MGVTANIMSLGGIAIAVGAMVDASIVVVEQTHKKLEEWERTGRKQDYHEVVINAVKEVAGPSFFWRAAGDRRVVPAGPHAGSAGGPTLQAAGIHEEFFHDHRGGAGHHARSGHAAALHYMQKNFDFRPRWMALGRQRGPGGEDSFGRESPH